MGFKRRISRISGGVGAEVDRIVEGAPYRVSRRGPGLAILIKDGQGVLFKKCCGLAKLSLGTPITPTTLFEIASLAKPFTATAVLILVERGELSLDDHMDAYLTELKRYCRGRRICIRDLLQHTSGVPEYLGWKGVPAANGEYLVNADFVRELARNPAARPLWFETRKGCRYSNTNYLLLASIVERVTDVDFATFMREKVFLPAGMEDTFVYDSPAASLDYLGPGRTTASG